VSFELPAGVVPFATGRDADVYELDSGRVLRRYRTGGDVADEAAVMRHAATHGYPVPAIYAAEGPELVLQRLDGPTILTAALRDEVSPDEVGRMLCGAPPPVAQAAGL